MKFKFCGNTDCPDWLITEIVLITKISSVKLRILCIKICNYIIKQGVSFDDLIKFIEDMKFSEDESKVIISVLTFIIKNAAKFDCEDTALNQELLQLGLMQENADSISKAFKTNKAKLRTFLQDDIFSFNKINNFDYKISYVLSDNMTKFEYDNIKENEDVMEDNYHIHNLDKEKINFNFKLENNENYHLTMDKETLGKLIKDLEKCSAIIKNYKEQV